MRIPTPTACLLASTLAAPFANAAYENPSTVPVAIRTPYIYASNSAEDPNYPRPSTIDLASFFKECTSPGPVLTFEINAPTSFPNSFRMQLFWLDPEPDAPSDTDDDYVSDDTDERYVYQPLDLNEPYAIAPLITNCVGWMDKNDPALPGDIFFSRWGTADEDDVVTPFATELGCYRFANDGTKHLTTSYSSWSDPNFVLDDVTKGMVSLYYNTTAYDYSLFFHLLDNTDTLVSSYFATIGKVFDDDMEVLQMIADGSTTLDATTVRYMSPSTFNAIPLWNSYTTEEYDTGITQPNAEDYVTVTKVTLSDLSGTYPTHGLGFCPALLVPTEDDEDTDEDESLTPTDPNATIKETFDCALSDDGILTLTLLDGVTLNKNYSYTYYYYFNVFVDDGVNDGSEGTDYYRAAFTLALYPPFCLYMPDAYMNSTVDYDLNTEDDVHDYWYWYSSSVFGWYMISDFPDERWAYSPEHGWLYLAGETTASEEGVFWYNNPSSYPDGEDDTDYIDDSIGWLWTSYSAYPWFYSYKDESWVYYLEKYYTADSDDDGEEDDDVVYSMGDRLFWSQRQNAYIAPSPTPVAAQLRLTKGRVFGTGLPTDTE